MAATKLSQYQAAIRHLGDARLDLITDDVETRYILDDAWDAAAAFCLRQAPWAFALKSVALTTGGVGVGGYATSYLFPSDWLRTHAVFQYSGSGRECPFDFRERGSACIAVNVSGGIVMRYVSSDFLDPALAGNPWPEHFAQAHAAYLAFSVAERVTGEPAAAGRMSQLFSSLLPQAVAIDALEEDPWLPHQRSGLFLRVSRAMAEEEFWRFTLKTALLSVASGTPEGGFSSRFAMPNDWLATRSLYQLTTDSAYVQGDQRRPFDVREHSGGWHTNVASFYVEYTASTRAFDATQWPDLYMAAVQRRLEFEAAAGGSKEGLEAAGAAWKDALSSVRKSEAVPPDVWLGHQLSGAFQRAVPAVMSRGYWRFALKNQLFTAETDQDAVPTDGAYPYRLTVPNDWLKTHALFVPWDGAELPIDIREHEGHWSTAAPSFMARYVSTAALTSTNWPDSVAKAVLAYLDLETAADAEKKNAAAVWAESLDAAMKEWSQPENRWLHYQLDGSFWEAVKFVLAAGRWRGAIKTVALTADATMAADGTVSGTPVPTAYGDGSISPSYSAVFRKPADWYRTIWLYRVDTNNIQVNSGYGYVCRDDIDYRDEGGAWHTQWDTIQVRYLSRDGLAGDRCPPSFRNAVLAWLQYQESGHDPRRLKAYEDLLSRAEAEDDRRERPPVTPVGRFVQARYGRRWIGNSGAGGGVSSSTQTILTDDSGNTFLSP